MKILILLLIFILSACTSNTLEDITARIKEKNLSLTKDDAIKYFFYTQDMDKVTTEPNSELESDYYYELLNSKEKLIQFNNFKKSDIIEKTDKYVLILLNLDDDYHTLAGTFAYDGTPINFLLLENSFGTNEFSIQRDYKLTNKNIFIISDERYDTDWIVFPTKGISKLTSHSDINITINKQGYFLKLNN